MSFLNALLAALGLIGAGVIIHWMLNDRRPDPADPENEDCNWTDIEEPNELQRWPK